MTIGAVNVGGRFSSAFEFENSDDAWVQKYTRMRTQMWDKVVPEDVVTRLIDFINEIESCGFEKGPKK